MLPESLLGPVLFHFSIALSRDCQGIHVSLVRHGSIVLLQIQMTTMSCMYFWHQLEKFNNSLMIVSTAIGFTLEAAHLSND